MSGDAGGLELSRESSWSLRSNTAVRVTLLCVNRKFPDAPFFNRPKLRDKDGKLVRRRIGGCEKRSPNLSATARFRAGSAGEVVSWENLETIHPPECGPRRTTQTLFAPQNLRGQLSSGNSAIEGLRFLAQPEGAGGFGAPIGVHAEAISCEGPNGPYTVQADDHTRGFTLTDHIGWESVIDPEPISEAMRFEIRPTRFGKAMRFTFGPLTQDPDLNRPPNLGAGQSHSAKTYSYTLRLDPCPRRGKSVGGC